MSDRPAPHLGLRHVALFVRAFEETKRFYVDLFGFRIEWDPDADNSYLSSGTDNLALHRISTTDARRETVLDHIGVIVRAPDDVDAWAQFLEARGVVLETQPRRHRDGARSFYVADPDGNRVQVIHHPPISGQPSSPEGASDRGDESSTG